MERPSPDTEQFIIEFKNSSVEQTDSSGQQQQQSEKQPQFHVRLQESSQEQTNSTKSNEKLPDPTQKLSKRLIRNIFGRKKQFEQINAKKTKSDTMLKIPIKRKSNVADMELNGESSEKATEPKEKRSKVELNEHFLDGFGQLSLEPLEKYDVSSIYFEIEKGQNASAMKVLEAEIAASTSDSTSYFNAYKKVLKLEEAAETIELQKFNLRSINLTYSKLGKFSKLKRA